MLGRNDLITALINNLLFAGKESNRCKPATTQREEKTAGTMRTTALVKVSVAQGRALPPEAHMIKCARQDFVLGEVRGKCVEGGSGGGYLYVLPILQWLGLIQYLRKTPSCWVVWGHMSCKNHDLGG